MLLASWPHWPKPITRVLPRGLKTVDRLSDPGSRLMSSHQEAARGEEASVCGQLAPGVCLVLVLTHLSSEPPREVETIVPILQTGNLRLREARQPAWSHRARKWKPQDLNPRLPDFKVSVPPAPTPTLHGAHTNPMPIRNRAGTFLLRSARQHLA